MAGKRASSRGKSGPGETPLLEWLLGAVGVMLLLAAVSYLAYEGAANEDGPGEIVVSTTQIIETQSAYIVRFQAHNRGSATVGNLHMSARLSDGNREVEVAHVLIDYLPGRSTRQGGVYLRNDPRRYRLEIRPEGYQKP
jgi:uncharacterized protein (TIGR02588 family)